MAANGQTAEREARIRFARIVDSLTISSQVIINEATRFAASHQAHAHALVAYLEQRVAQVPAEQKLFILHLIHNIITVIGRHYIDMLAPCIGRMFLDAYYAQVRSAGRTGASEPDVAVRGKYEKLLVLWYDGLQLKAPLFPIQTLDAIVDKLPPNVQGKLRIERDKILAAHRRHRETIAASAGATPAISASSQHPSHSRQSSSVSAAAPPQQQPPQQPQQPPQPPQPPLPLPSAMDILRALVTATSSARSAKQAEQRQAATRNEADYASQQLVYLDDMIKYMNSLNDTTVSDVQSFYKSISSVAKLPPFDALLPRHPTISKPVPPQPQPQSHPQSQLHQHQHQPAPTSAKTSAIDITRLVSSIRAQNQNQQQQTTQAPNQQHHQQHPLTALPSLTDRDINGPAPAGAHTAIYDAFPSQCGQCGIRFPSTPQGGSSKSLHLDWHFRQKNRLAKLASSGAAGGSSGKDSKLLAVRLSGQIRGWFLNPTDWANGCDLEPDAVNGQNGSPSATTTTTSTNAAAAAANSTSTSNQMATGDNDALDESKWVVVVPSHLDHGSISCPVCNEKFIPKLNYDSEEWEIIGAKEIGHGASYRIVHVGCQQSTTGSKRQSLASHEYSGGNDYDDGAYDAVNAADGIDSYGDYDFDSDTAPPTKRRNIETI
ncbi:hypothetical protein GQ42DRAFT_164020 [Ramicandelaber brevisporus]|nr:hypothetical protein GQ42DRAFT_164020 [Ramicandelaber brevisporus]